MTDITSPSNLATSPNPSAIAQAADLISKADSICVLTGAGISAESGIPTFRDKQTGLWENYRAEDLASIDAFDRDPKMVWSWYQWRRNLVKDKQPNSAHHALHSIQEWAQQQGKTLALITQNVDDLHEQAGSEVTHLHGHLWRNKCSECGAPYNETIDYSEDGLLSCPQCDGYIRPDIVWFGEMLPQDEWRYAEYAVNDCDVFISIGTSSLVYPAAGLLQVAKQQGAAIIEINLNPTQNPLVDIELAGKAGEVLPKLQQSLLS
ncbi:SIR2 family NAD-dependent protein deacylase [Psychrobacter sp. FDAARGOS_221]|uniref:SIR2 family NAD-dependent protein deacylase n=1 Tax=Psychrobacter sp. FDAARGOS_221 TaxID=1975705 RepID=UPI000BB59ABC|nr:NAD-dependent deacylase [Psychrobacter sp. FDAARGOS_221]PNK60155.1 NAD-dependent deacylase [Psychrobacter sp. FDAARGOS_221]